MEQAIKNILAELGADLCGIAGVDRFADAPQGFHPTDVFPQCKAVVVLAKRMPAGLAQVNPRIVYNRYNDLVLEELDRITLEAALQMEKLGILAVPIPSDSPYEFWDAEEMRGMGTISLRHAAVLAGLGSFGKSSMVLNKDYGNMISLGAILVDVHLQSDPLAEEVCLPSCRRCLDACPTKALGGKSVIQKNCRPHTYQKHQRGFGVVNCNACRVVCPLSSVTN